MSDLHLWHRDELNKLRQDMQELFDCLVHDFCGPFDMRMLREEPELRVEVEGDSVVITVRAPDLDPDSLKLSALGPRLFISGEKIHADEECRIITRRSFASTVHLTCLVRLNQVEVRFDGGVLRIQLPKCPTAARPRVNGSHMHNERGRND